MSRDLKLQVVLSAIDKATAPIRGIMQSSSGLGKQLKETRDQLRSLEKQQGAINSFRELKRGSEQSATALQGQQRRVKELARQLAATPNPTKAMTREFDAATRAAGKLKTAHGNNTQQLQAVRTRLQQAGVSTRNLGTEEASLRKKITETNSALAAQKSQLESVAAQQKKLAGAKAQMERTQQLAGNMATTGAASMAVGAAIGAPVLGLVKSYMTFEDAMAGVAKQVESARDDNGRLTETYYQIAEAIKEISTRIPMATTEIAALIEGGARMGIQGQRELLKFAEVAANAATAFELPADKIGEDLARIAGLFKIPINELDKLGDVINYLDDNSLAKGSDLIESMTRLSDIADKMDFRDVAAFSGTFLNIGRQADTAATATRAMVRELANARMRGKTFQQGMKMLGLSSDKIQKRMSHDATGTLLEVLEKLKDVRADQQMEVAERLFGKQFGKDASALSQNLEMLREQLRMTRSTDAEGSMQREADIRADLLSARLEMARNRASSLAATMGATLQPVLIELIESFNNTAGRVMSWVSANPKLTGQMLKTAAGVAILAAGFGAVTLAMASFIGPLAVVRYSLTVLGIKGISVIGTFKGIAAGLLTLGKALMTNPIFLAIGLLAAAAYLIYRNWDDMVGGFMALLEAFGTWWADTTAILAQDWDYLTGLISAGWDSLWGGITGMLDGIWSTITEAFNGGIAGITALLLNWSPLGIFWQIMQPVFDWFGLDLPAKFSEFGANIIGGLVDGIKNMAGAAKDAVMNVGDNVTGWFKDKLGIHSPSRVFAELGGHTIDGLAVGMQAQEDGPLKRIGELGKKLTAAAGLSIPLVAGAAEPLQFDNRPPLQAMGNQGAAGGGNNYTIQITVNGAADTTSLAAEVRKQIEAFEREKAVRQRSRFGDLD